MSSIHDIAGALDNPRLLEEMYRHAVQAGEGAAWAANIVRLHEQAPDNLLLAAWRYRLQPGAAMETPTPAAHSWRMHWQLAAPLGLLLGLAYWILSDAAVSPSSKIPHLFYLWAPLAALAIIALVAWGASAAKPWRRALVVAAALLALALYVVWVGGMARTHYQELAVIHLPLAAWIAIGLTAAGRGSDDGNRFAFLIKSTEAVVTGGVFAGAAVLFLAITFGLFEAIGVRFPDALARLLACLAAGLVPILAVAAVYDARYTPLEQRFDDGLSKLISTLGRFFLPLTLVVGVVYVISIPFNFWRPFEQRDVLIVYNLMLFAIMGLLVFATPVATAGVAPAVLLWLRRGIVVVAALALLVSLYALSATVYRTIQGGLTINRTTIIGWNVINMAILAHVLYGQWRAAPAGWLPAVYRSCRMGMICCALWTVFLLLALPWLFPL